MREGIQSGFEAIGQQASRTWQSAEGTVSEHPATSLMVSFGIGFGLGLIVTAMLSQSEESWGDWADRQTRGTRDHANEALRRLPDAFHSLADSIRAMPAAFAERMPSGFSRH
jgi:ElaB/YqjD/DUF883 family membrane-anchored ribosome-binding protein